MACFTSGQLDIVVDMPYRLRCPVIDNNVDPLLDLYLLPVMNVHSQKTVCYIWHEGLGVRGTNEISSCLSIFFSELLMPFKVTHLVVSTTCFRDLSFALFVKLVSQHESIDTIVVKKVAHDFPLPNFGPCIEQKRKETLAAIHHPDDWQRLIETMKINENNLTVKQMKRENFFDFRSLFEHDAGPLQKPKFNTDGERLSVPAIQWLQFRKTKPFEVLYKTNQNEDLKALNVLSFDAIDFDPSVLVLQPRTLFRTSRAIPFQKKVRLSSVLHLINPSYHDFYNSLRVVERQPDEDLYVMAEDAEDLVNEVINLEEPDSGWESNEDE